MYFKFSIDQRDLKFLNSCQEIFFKNKDKNIMKRLNILVTGGAGYLGSIISTKLIEIGHNVTVIDILEFNKTSLSHLFVKKGFKFIKGDVRNKTLLKNLIKKDIIIPLAALVGAPLCDKYPKKLKKLIMIQ